LKLKPERNALCPCGSGKKYKKCCGLPCIGEQGIPARFRINRAVAYKGAIGSWREDFCRAYTVLKRARLQEMDNKLKEMVSVGETISCSRGCTHCCEQFVAASLQECESIVYYLYRHDEAMEHFIRAFSIWRDRILRIEPTFRKINELGEKIVSGQATEEELKLLKEEGRVYDRQKNPCPFLINASCSIYDVRPYICAGHLSTSPRDWCEASHPDNPRVRHITITVPLGNDMPYFIQPKSKHTFSPLPLLVHRILEEGYGALSTIKGLEPLRDEVLNDPEVLAALRDAGAI
jgi:Fe-S-cluster containining protein